MTAEQAEVIFMENQSVSYLAGFQAIIDAVIRERDTEMALKYLEKSAE